MLKYDVCHATRALVTSGFTSVSRAVFPEKPLPRRGIHAGSSGDVGVYSYSGVQKEPVLPNFANDESKTGAYSPIFER
jgi:hypothetical protein